MGDLECIRARSSSGTLVMKEKRGLMYQYWFIVYALNELTYTYDTRTQLHYARVHFLCICMRAGTRVHIRLCVCGMSCVLWARIT